MKQSEDLMRGVVPQKQTIGSYFKGSKVFKRGRNSASAPTTPAPAQSEPERKLM